MQCNIDSKGKVIRMVNGMILIIAGIALMIVWAWGSGSVIAWIVTIAVGAAGGLSIFEARAGWCALRAMGFKTPL